MNAQIRRKLENYPEPARRQLQIIRNMIFDIAAADARIGEIVESIKWGQASFTSMRPKSGTPIRIDANMDDNSCSVFVPCSTSLIEDFRTHHPEMFDYHGNREIRFALDKKLPTDELAIFLGAALRYYLQ